MVSVPLVAVFTKFDGLVISEYCELHAIQDEQVKLKEARENAEKTFQEHYLHQIMKVKNPPKAFVKLEGKTFFSLASLQNNSIAIEMDKADRNCPELTEQTAAAIDVGSLCQLFSSTQQNNYNLCIKLALESVKNMSLCTALREK